MEISYVRWLRELAHEIGVSPRVHFRGTLSSSEVGDLIATAGCLIQPSRVESLCLPLLEALQMGLPVVSTDIPVAREVGRTHARYYPPGDVGALAAQISSLGSETAKGREERAQKSKHLGWNSAADQLLSVLLGGGA